MSNICGEFFFPIELMKNERKRRQEEQREEGKGREERRKRKIRKQQCDQIWVKKIFFFLLE